MIARHILCCEVLVLALRTYATCVQGTATCVQTHATGMETQRLLVVQATATCVQGTATCVPTHATGMQPQNSNRPCTRLCRRQTLENILQPAAVGTRDPGPNR